MWGTRGFKLDDFLADPGTFRMIADWEDPVFIEDLADQYHDHVKMGDTEKAEFRKQLCSGPVNEVFRIQDELFSGHAKRSAFTMKEAILIAKHFNTANVPAELFTRALLGVPQKELRKLLARARKLRRDSVKLDSAAINAQEGDRYAAVQYKGPDEITAASGVEKEEGSSLVSTDSCVLEIQISDDDDEAASELVVPLTSSRSPSPEEKLAGDVEALAISIGSKCTASAEKRKRLGEDVEVSNHHIYHKRSKDSTHNSPLDASQQTPTLPVALLPKSFGSQCARLPASVKMAAKAAKAARKIEKRRARNALVRARKKVTLRMKQQSMDFTANPMTFDNGFQDSLLTRTNPKRKFLTHADVLPRDSRKRSRGLRMHRKQRKLLQNFNLDDDNDTTSKGSRRVRNKKAVPPIPAAGGSMFDSTPAPATEQSKQRVHAQAQRSNLEVADSDACSMVSVDTAATSSVLDAVFTPERNKTSSAVCTPATSPDSKFFGSMTSDRNKRHPPGTVFEREVNNVQPLQLMRGEIRSSSTELTSPEAGAELPLSHRTQRETGPPLDHHRIQKFNVLEASKPDIFTSTGLHTTISMNQAAVFNTQDRNLEHDELEQVEDFVTSFLSEDSLDTSEAAKTTTVPAHRPTTPPKATMYVNAPKLSPYFARPPKSRSTSRSPAKSCIPFAPLGARNFGLIQEQLASNPFHLLLATTLLNRTKGTAALPAFFALVDAYPDAESLASASLDDVIALTHHLGLQNVRARTLVALAQAWLEHPPERDRRHRTLNYPFRGAGANIAPGEVLDDIDDRFGAWEIAHLPGVGDYALDSWRIFCRDKLRGVANGYDGEGAAEGDFFETEWMRVLPRDKELRAYLRWKWLREGVVWDCGTGEASDASEELIAAASQDGFAWEEWFAGNGVAPVVAAAAAE